MTSKTFKIKLYDGVIVKSDGEEIRLDHIADLWPLFKWDIKNDESAKAAALEVTRQLIAFGYVDMSAAIPKGHTLTVEIIPPTND